MTKEEFYDTEIAPVLLELSRKCKAEGIDMIAAVEFDEGVGKTYCVSNPDELGVDMLLAYAALISKGNIDTMVTYISKKPQVRGHNSVVLHLMGI